MSDILAAEMLYIQHFGYYGAQTQERVEWSVQNARGKLSTLEEYLTRNPLRLA
jgi:hypothetical protein